MSDQEQMSKYNFADFLLEITERNWVDNQQAWLNYRVLEIVESNWCKTKFN